MNKKQMSEEDIKLKYITPAITNSGWDIMEQIFTEYTANKKARKTEDDMAFTDGKVVVRKNMTVRKKRKSLDYILFFKPNLPLAVIEAKNNKHSVGSGLQQGIEYAEILDVPFVYASNGDGFVERDMLNGTEKKIKLNEFPSPRDLWSRYKEAKSITTDEKEQIITQPYYYSETTHSPRYYQRIAINRTLEAIANGKKRVMLTMATGTGKTYTAFQIMWRLRESKKVKKILFLADRNVLVDQTVNGDFRPFKDLMTKIQEKELDSAYEIHLALYHQLVESKKNDKDNPFEQFSRNYFDLVVIDEAHRSSAKENGAWRAVLEYFDSAIHLGLTATPKETKDVSNEKYFGEPIYTYSLKQGIDDGFLAPYRVLRVALNKDYLGYRPEKGKVDINGEVIPDNVYYGKDMEKTIVIDERTEVVAKKITEYLKKNGRYKKTIVFCYDIPHANRMRRALINENSDLVKENSKYVVKITGDSKTKEEDLDSFMATDERYPVIAVTSRLMSTGVNAKMCELIVLDKEIKSIITFKQIIGRGTRLLYDKGKKYFTIMDFRNATEIFADPDFDGNPEVVYEKNENEDMPNELENQNNNTDENKDDELLKGGIEEEKVREKIHVNGVDVKILTTTVQIMDENGNLVTESITKFFKDQIKNKYSTLDDFLNKWDEERRKEAIIEELEKEGVIFEILQEKVGKDYDAFDLIRHIAFDKEPISRTERVNRIKSKGYLDKYSEQAQNVVNVLLEKYKDDNIVDFGSSKILNLNEFKKYGSPLRIKKSIFGGSKKFRETMSELEHELHG